MESKICLAIKNLVDFTESEISALSRLEVSEWQEIKGGSFDESVEAWQKDTTGNVLGFCFLIQSDLVGMTLFKRPPLSPSWATADAASIHGLKISTPWQCQGLGHKAFKLAVEQLKVEWPKISKLVLAVDADNDAALAVYRAYGMSESGPIYKGNDGLENRFQIPL